LPLAELVLSGLGTETNDALADYPQVALMLRTVMGSRVARRRRASQVSLCRELITLVRDSTTPAGVLVVLEDIEAADRATLDILGLGLTRLVGVPVAVLLTCAENGRDASRALDDSLARVAASLDVIVLKPLPRSAVSILAHEFSGHPLGAATITRIHRLARGNPLAVRQVCLAMAGGARLAELSPPHEVFRIVEGEVTPAT
jgi:predicted ATPase